MFDLAIALLRDAILFIITFFLVVMAAIFVITFVCLWFGRITDVIPREKK